MGGTRFIIALVLGFIGAVVIWFAAPYNNFVLGNAFISDDFLPVAAVGMILPFVLLINPLLHRFAPALKLTFAQLSLIFGMFLVACITPGQGGMRHIFYPIGATPAYVSRDANLAKSYEELDLPDSFFPEELKFNADVPASEWFLDELPKGETVPWSEWRGPLLSWGAFFLPYWIMLTAMAVIVLPYWRDTERQPFPLLEVQQTIIGDTEGHAFPPILRNRLFWAGAATVFILHLMVGGNSYFPGSIPAIKLKFNLTQAFETHPLNYLPYYIKVNHIYFVFLGIAFFMPNRVGFSVWFLQIIYAVYILIRGAYIPPFDDQMITDQRIGAWIVLPLSILWMGRRHWASVIRSVFKRPTTDEDLRSKVAGIALLLGMTGVFGWLLWVHVPFLWALGMLTLLFLFALGMTRIVAETGIPLMAPDSFYATTLAGLIPLAWRTAAGMYFAGFIGIVSGNLNRICATTIVAHAIGLNRKASPRMHIRLATVFLLLIIASVLIGGAFQLIMVYHHASSIDGVWTPIGYGGAGYFREYPEAMLREYTAGHITQHSFSEWGHIIFGGGVALFLQVMCQVSARWPVHPVAMLFVGNWYAQQIWFSVFLGWMLKVLTLKYGGARAYRKARGLFLGLIIGEVFAVVFWVILTAIVAALGFKYKVVEILPF